CRHAVCRSDGGERGPRGRGGADAGSGGVLRVRQDRRRRVPRPEQGGGQLRGRGLPPRDRPADRRDRAPPDGWPSHVGRVPEGHGAFDWRHAPPLRDAARCPAPTVLDHVGGHPEGVPAPTGATGARVRASTAPAGRRLRTGGDLMSEEIVSDLMRAHVYRLASTGQRVDGRALDEPRKLSLERTYVKTAEGSARATLGNTDVLVGIDIHVLDYDGNLFDACSYGATAALGSTVVPAKNQGLGDDFALPVEHWPVSVTTAKIKDVLFVDPALDEERMSDARITVTTDENGDIRAMQKGLSGSFTYDEVKRIIETAQRVGRGIRPLLRSS